MEGDKLPIHGEWSNLPKELLVSILWKLPCIFDCIKFGSVCTWWLSVLLENCHLLNCAPFLMSPEKNSDNKYELICPSNGKVLQIHLQQAHNKTIFGFFMCCLLTVDQGSGYAIRLLNPFTGTERPLPPATTLPTFHSTGWNLDYGHFIHKIVLSTNDTSSHNCVAVALYGNQYRLSFSKVGDEKWTTFDNQRNAFDDVTCYQGKFYAVRMDGGLVLCDVGPDPKLISTTPPIPNSFHCRKYLVESSGNLLKVTRPPNLTVNRSDMDCEFLVHKLDLVKNQWTKVESLGDQVLFLGSNCSRSIPARNLFQHEANCITFFEHGASKSRGVFDLTDGRIQVFYGSHSPVLLVTPSPF